MTGLDEEIREVEARIAHERAQSLQAFDAYKEHLRDQATSFTSLAALVAVGFAAGTLLQLRMKKAPVAPGMSMVSLLASVATAIAGVRRRRRDSVLAERIGAGGARRPSEAEGYPAVDQARGGAT
jgi:hypothetical protein